MTEEEILQKLNILGIYTPDQLEEEDLNMWWHKKYLDIRDSQIKKETFNEKLNEINQIVLELSKKKKWKLIEILSKSINEKDEIDEISTIKEEIESIQLQIDQAKRSFDLNKAAELEFGTLYSLKKKLKEKSDFLSNDCEDQKILKEMNKKEFITYLIQVGEINQEVIDRSMEVSDFPLARKLLLKIEGFIENILHPKNSAELDLARGELLSNCILNNREIKHEGIKFVDEIVNAVRLKNNFKTKDEHHFLNEIEEKKVKSLYLENEVISDIDLYNQGLEYFNQKEYQKSIRKLSNAIDLNANDPNYYRLRGWAYYCLDNNDKAIEDATKAIDLKSDEPDHYNLRGWAYYCLDNNDKAIEDAIKAIDLNPDEPIYYELKQDSLNSNILKKIKRSYVNCDYEKTILQCNEAISSNNKIAYYFFYRGLSKQFSNKVYKNNSILNDFDIAIDLNPEDPYIWASRGSLKVQIDYNGNYIENAIEDISKAIELNNKIAEFYYRSGHAKFYNEQEEDALVDLNKSINQDPNNNEGYLNDCLNLIEEINGFNNSTKEDGFGYVFLAKSINSQDKYRIGTATNKGDLKRKVGNDSLIVSSKECKGYEHLATVICRRYKNNRIGNSDYFSLNDVQYNSVKTSLVRSFSKDNPAYGSGFLSDLFTD